jgi:nucleophosmin 1
MGFWGVEVKAGEPIKVNPDPSFVIHLSQACLGETKKDKGNDSVVLTLKIGDQKLVLGMLSMDKIPQLSFDLVFEKEFELSHNWKNGSVYFCGYQTLYGDEDENDFEEFDDSEEEEDVPAIAAENGKGGLKLEQAKPATTKASEKPKVKVVEPSKDDDAEDSDEEDDDSDDDEEGSEDESDEDMVGADSDDGDEDSDEDDDEETHKKVDSSKKRPNQSAIKTPVPAKKAKSDTPQKSGGKKGAHTATPHPAKNAGKTPVSGDKSKAQTPKSGGQFSCKSCTKSFGSEIAVQSHSKAKHGGS